MPAYEVHLQFVAADDRETVLSRLRSFELPDGHVIEDGADARIALAATTRSDVALERALVIVRAACELTDVPAERVHLHPSAWPGS
jgi:hypothetical protein